MAFFDDLKLGLEQAIEYEKTKKGLLNTLCLLTMKSRTRKRSKPSKRGAGWQRTNRHRVIKPRKN